MITVIAFLIVLGLAVLVHELGHYWAARMSGVRVLTFSIGFGPALFKWKDRRGTEWRFSIVPLGGYVQLYGNEDIFDRKVFEQLPTKKKEGHYLSASMPRRIFICIAGVLMNFILAFAIYTGFAMQPRTVQLPVVGEVVSDSIAWNAGVRAGDVITRIDGVRIRRWGDILDARYAAGDSESMMQVLRNNEYVIARLHPAPEWGIVADASKTAYQYPNFFRAVQDGAVEVYVQSANVLSILSRIITGEVSANNLGGFIFIAQLSGEALAAGIIALLALVALLSINFAILNLLPLPVLDGGTLVILLSEWITGKKPQGRWLMYTFVTGWVFLLALFAFVMWNDLVRLLGM